VLVVIYTRQGEFLLMERNHPHGFWQSVTGSLEWGEQGAAAAAREVAEETGLFVGHGLQDLAHQERFPIIFPWRKRYVSQYRFNTEHWFALPLSGRRSIRLDPAEHRQYRWLPAQAAIQRASSWTNRKAIELIASRSPF
jgi:dATP pyrophosphohydrolase